MSKNYSKTFPFIMMLVLSLQFVVATPVYSDKSPVNTGLTYECFESKAGPGGQDRYGNCTWTDLVAATRNFINKIVLIALELSVFVIAWAGFNYMTSGGNSSKKDNANQMLWKVAQGIAIIMLAWLVVNLIATTLLDKQIVKINIINNGQ